MATRSNFVKTSIIVLSDTHGMTLEGRVPEQAADVCIHAGDLTEESRLEEFYSAITLLRMIEAPLKLVIAGNHDFTLDTPLFRKKIQAIQPPLEPELVNKFYGEYEEAKQLLMNAKKHGIHLLNEGTHEFELQNGAKLRVYASPYTPSLGDWGFQYHPDQGHDFAIQDETNIVITHGPPRGILDRTNSQQRAGCPDLFAAVAKAKPQLHCFGHIHEGWGAKMVAWRSNMSERPSFLTDIDNSASHLIEQLSTLHENKYDGPEEVLQKKQKYGSYISQKHCSAEFTDSDVGKTLFVNAAIKGDHLDADLQLPWVVDITLPRSASVTRATSPTRASSLTRASSPTGASSPKSASSPTRELSPTSPTFPATSAIRAAKAATEEGTHDGGNRYTKTGRKRALEHDRQDEHEFSVRRRKFSTIN